ncbi:hypothetical protein PG990_001613 [Apiospora arundinis]|uniref:Uncharacterized protein n=1 Tax=Apiospora arundinis TaxID=335852 RepID=A0ABR2HRW6_9PEZI
MEKHEQILRFLAESRPSLLQQVFDHIDTDKSPYEELKLHEDKPSLWLMYHFGPAYEYTSFCSAIEQPLDEYLKIRGHILALLFMWERITDDAFCVFEHGKPRPEDKLPSGLTPKQWLVVRRFILTRAKFGGMIPDLDGKYDEVCVPSEFREKLSKVVAEKAAAEKAADEKAAAEKAAAEKAKSTAKPANSIFGTTKSNKPTQTVFNRYFEAKPATPGPGLFGINAKSDKSAKADVSGSTGDGNKGKEVI